MEIVHAPRYLNGPVYQHLRTDLATSKNPGTKSFCRAEYKIINKVYTAPLSGRCSKLPRAGVILPQIIPQCMWGPEYVKIESI